MLGVDICNPGTRPLVSVSTSPSSRSSGSSTATRLLFTGSSSHLVSCFSLGKWDKLPPHALFQQADLRHFLGSSTKSSAAGKSCVFEEADGKERLVGRTLLKEENHLWRLVTLNRKIVPIKHKMDSVSKARTRLGRYPALLAACAPQAAAYGKCVGEALGEVQKNQCASQFQDFMKCVRQEAKRLGTRLWYEVWLCRDNGQTHPRQNLLS